MPAKTMAAGVAIAGGVSAAAIATVAAGPAMAPATAMASHGCAIAPQQADPNHGSEQHDAENQCAIHRSPPSFKLREPLFPRPGTSHSNISEPAALGCQQSAIRLRLAARVAAKCL